LVDNFRRKSFCGYLFAKTFSSETGRCSKSSFKSAQELFKQYVTDSKKATLTAKGVIKNKCKALGLPETITVRFVKIKLSTGETEVLVTSLLDSEKYTTEMLKELYKEQRGIECIYGVRKERLKIDNFTGKTVISIKQDFYATIFLIGLESILTQQAEMQLFDKSRQNQHRQIVNKMVSFNAKFFDRVILPLFTNSRTYENINRVVYQGSNLC